MPRWIKVLILIGFFFPGIGRAEIFFWIDNQGVKNYSARIENIPAEYRSRAEVLSLPPVSLAPPSLKPNPPAKGPTRISFTPGAPILTRVKINGLGPITLILDTGAERTMISPTILSQLNLSVENEPPVILKGVTGAGPAQRVWVNSIEIGDLRVGPLLIAVYPADLKGAEGLLGRDFLADLNLTIDSKGGVVTLTPNH